MHNSIPFQARQGPYINPLWGASGPHKGSTVCVRFRYTCKLDCLVWLMIHCPYWPAEFFCTDNVGYLHRRSVFIPHQILGSKTQIEGHRFVRRSKGEVKDTHVGSVAELMWWDYLPTTNTNPFVATLQDLEADTCWPVLSCLALRGSSSWQVMVTQALLAFDMCSSTNDIGDVCEL